MSKFESYKHQKEVVGAFSQLPPEILPTKALALIGEIFTLETRNIKFLIKDLKLEKVLILGSLPCRGMPSWCRIEKLDRLY
jgi:hypothetical protein